jgi:hypothetical protein
MQVLVTQASTRSILHQISKPKGFTSLRKAPHLHCNDGRRRRLTGGLSIRLTAIGQCWHHLHLWISHPRPHCGGRAGASRHKTAASLTRGVRAHSLTTAHRAHTRVSITTYLGTHSRRRVTSPPSMPLGMRRSCLVQHKEEVR